MMQGRGVTNYAGDKPSHSLTTNTTEFDDALLARGIVTTEQVMLAKGASPEEAVRLAREKHEERQNNHHSFGVNGTSTVTNPSAKSSTQRNPGSKDVINSANDDDDDNDNEGNDDDGSDSDSFQDDIDNDELFARYRQERMAQLETSTANFVEHIARGDWSTKVNEASQYRWVLITLIDSSTRQQEILQELYVLAKKYSAQFSLLTIEATDAVPTWPKERIPAMFAYRNGVKQEEWITNKPGEFPLQQCLEKMFKMWGVLERTPD